MDYDMQERHTQRERGTIHTGLTVKVSGARFPLAANGLGDGTLLQRRAGARDTHWGTEWSSTWLVNPALIARTSTVHLSMVTGICQCIHFHTYTLCNGLDNLCKQGSTHLVVLPACLDHILGPHNSQLSS